MGFPFAGNNDPESGAALGSSVGNDEDIRGHGMSDGESSQAQFFT
jgi:hypothetical protein